MLGLSVYVMDPVNKQEPTKHGTGVQVLPGGIVVPDANPPGAAPSAGGPLDAARTVACATDAQSLRDAEDQYKVLNGRYADLPTLVSDQSPARPSTLYRVESADGFATYQLVGPAAAP